MTTLHVTLATDPAGSRHVELRCACLRLHRVLTQWEPVEDAVADMLAEHRNLAPRCPHPPIGLAAEVRP